MGESDTLKTSRVASVEERQLEIFLLVEMITVPSKNYMSTTSGGKFHSPHNWFESIHLHLFPGRCRSLYGISCRVRSLCLMNHIVSGLWTFTSNPPSHQTHTLCSSHTLPSHVTIGGTTLTMSVVWREGMWLMSPPLVFEGQWLLGGVLYFYLLEQFLALLWEIVCRQLAIYKLMRYL